MFIDKLLVFSMLDQFKLGSGIVQCVLHNVKSSRVNSVGHYLTKFMREYLRYYRFHLYVHINRLCNV